MGKYSSHQGTPALEDAAVHQGKEALGIHFKLKGCCLSCQFFFSKQHSPKKQLPDFGCRELQRLCCHTHQWHFPSPVLCQSQGVHNFHSALFCDTPWHFWISTEHPRVTWQLWEHTAFSSGVPHSVPTVVSRAGAITWTQSKTLQSCMGQFAPLSGQIMWKIKACVPLPMAHPDFY